MCLVVWGLLWLWHKVLSVFLPSIERTLNAGDCALEPTVVSWVGGIGRESGDEHTCCGIQYSNVCSKHTEGRVWPTHHLRSEFT